MAKPAIIVHGGAWTWEKILDEHKHKGMKQATHLGWEILKKGGSALDAVEKAVNYLEDHHSFNAGTGGSLNANGEVELDALIVDGTDINFGAVAGVKHVKNPISLARRVMTASPHNFIIAAGADDFARQCGIIPIPNIQLITSHSLRVFRRKKTTTSEEKVASADTVGAVALDTQGNLASATSTGGTDGKLPGRVGDSPILGAGGYAANHSGAASATGKGENIMRVLLSKYAVDHLCDGLHAQEVATICANYLDGHFKPSDAGIILVDKEGNIGAAHTTPKMALGWVDNSGKIQTSMHVGVRGIPLTQ